MLISEPHLLFASSKIHLFTLGAIDKPSVYPSVYITVLDGYCDVSRIKYCDVSRIKYSSNECQKL